MNKTKKFNLYVITNKLDGKKYVGLTTNSVSHRWRSHTSDAARGSKMRIHAAIRKYGKDSFHVEHVACSTSADNMFAAESLLILQEKSSNPIFGYNSSAGGECGGLGSVRSEEFRQAIRASTIGNKRALGVKRSAETREKMSAWQKGREVSAERRAQISLSLTGRKLSPEHVAAASSARRGVKITVTEKVLAAAKAKGEKRRGSKLSDEAKERASIAGKTSEKLQAHLKALAIRRFGTDHRSDPQQLPLFAQGGEE